MNGLVGGLLDSLGARQVAELFQHAHVGERFDFRARGFHLGQLAHQFVARREAEHFGHDVGVQAVACRHPARLHRVDNLGRQAHDLEFAQVEAPGAERLGIDHLVAGPRFHVGGVVVGNGVLRVAAQFLEELVLKLAQVVFAVLVQGEVAVLPQRFAHGVDGQAALTAQHVLAERRHGDALFRVDAPLGLHRRAIQTAQLGDGSEQGVLGFVDAIRARRALGRRRDLVVGGQLAGEELPGAINRLAHDFAAHVHAHLGALRLGVFL